MHSPLGGLPTPLLAAICSFLPVEHNISVSRQAFHNEAIVELALRRSHFTLSGSIARQLAACSSPRTRAVLGLVPSLAVSVCCESSDASPHRWRQDLAALFQLLASATAAPLFLFSHLTSLRFHVEGGSSIQRRDLRDLDAWAPVQRLLRLIDESPASFASLARLHLSGYHSAELTVRSWDALSCLQALTHLRVQWLRFSLESASSFLSALARLPVLQCVDLTAVDLKDSQALLTLDCHLWARRLKVLRLPCFFDLAARKVRADRVAEFMHRLALSPSERPDHASLSEHHRFSALHSLHLDVTRTTAAMLCAAFSLVSLTDLKLTGLCSAVDFSSFCAAQLADASWQCALRRLTLPAFLIPADTTTDGAGNESIDAIRHATRTEHDSRLRALLARCVALTDLTVSLNTALEVSGCCLAPLHRLQRLCVNGWPNMQRLTGSSELTFPALRELSVSDACVTDAALETLLRACPALWSLQLLEDSEMQSWSVASIAVALCPQLVRLQVSAAVIVSDIDAAKGRVISPALAAPACSSLAVFSLVDTRRSSEQATGTPISYDPSADLRLLASDPSSSQLRLFELHQPLTSQQLQRLCALPTLTRLHVCWDWQLHDAVYAAMQSLLSCYQLERPAAGRPPVARQPAPSPSVAHELCEAAMSAAPARSAGELIDRALAEHCNMDDLLDFPGVPVQEVKRRLIEELRSRGAD